MPAVHEDALVYMSQGLLTTSERLGKIIRGVASLIAEMSVTTYRQRREGITHEFPKGILQSTTSCITDATLQLVNILLIARRDLLDVALGQVACFVLAHGA